MLIIKKELIIGKMVKSYPKYNILTKREMGPVSTGTKLIITLPILQTSEIGDLVLDPFCGSGNVGKVCDILERNFVGYDLNNYIS
ncbi:MAG: hypothetical protein ISP58_07055 [Flavobacteriales bacterium]|nr:hypothetical protein [Flavobacteriales bacterium]